MGYEEAGMFRFAIRVDETTTPNVTYVGKAPLGALDSEARWQIQKIDETTAVMMVLWADGNDQMDNVWTDRATTIVYS